MPDVAQYVEEVLQVELSSCFIFRGKDKANHKPVCSIFGALGTNDC